MKHLFLFILSILLLNPLCSVAAAKAGGIVEIIQMPAWYDHDGRSYPLKAGTKIFSGDRIRTGKNARVVIRMQEDSVIKLGEDTSLTFSTLSPAGQADGLFTAILHLTHGAFRFSTTEISKTYKRRLDVKIGVVTISAITGGVHGTDIWVHSSPNENLFALLEGQATVKHNGEKTLTVQNKLSYIITAKDQPDAAITPIILQDLNDWVKETEAQHRHGSITTNGEWAVNVMSLNNTKAAAQLQQKLNKGGYASNVQRIQIAGKTWLRVRIEGFTTRPGANAFASRINYMYGIEQPWAAKR